MKKLLLFGVFASCFNISAQTFGGGVTDIDGNNYTSVIIGDQEWMAENLRTSRYSNGDTIPNDTNGIQWNLLNTGVWAHYDNDSLYETPFGKLYNWYAVSDSANICPIGWHVPSNNDWDELIDTLGSNVGGKLKSTGTTYWWSPNSGATNETGFSALPSGNTQAIWAPSFFGNGMNAHFWSSTEQSVGSAYDYVLQYNSASFGSYYDEKHFGFCIRCIKNVPINTVTQLGAQLCANQDSAFYQWVDCDNNYSLIIGDTNQCFIPAVTGNYAVIVSYNSVVDTSDCFLVDYTGMEELFLGEKELVKIVDFIGRETEFKPNIPLIFIYSDGTRERVMKLEE